MSLIARLLPDNPVLTKELRVRMRGSRAYWMLFGYLGILSVLLWFQYYGWLNQVHTSGSGGGEAARLGNEIFIYLLVAQMFLVLFITPAITSGALTIEKEQLTLDVLILTRLSRRSIIAGKLLSAVSFTALLIVSSLPLVSICFMLGSVDPKMVLSTYLEMLMGSVLIGAMGLMWSSVMKTTTLAVMATYGSVFLIFIACLIIAVPFTMGAMGGMGGGGGSSGILGSSMVAIYQSWFGNSYLGIPVIEGVGFAVFCFLGAWVLCAVAMVRLEMFPERKALMLRLLSALIVGLQLLSIDTWWVQGWYNRGGGAIMGSMEPPIGALTLTCLALLLLIPIFGTGDLRPSEARNYLGYLAKGWTLKGLTRGKLHSGLPYLMLMALLALGLFALSFALVGKSANIMNSSIGAAATTTPSNAANMFPPGMSSPPPSALVVGPNGKLIPANPAVRGAPAAAAVAPPAPNVGDFPQAAAAILATVFGFGMLCLFLSVLFRNRWIAWLIAYVLLLLVLTVPEIANYSASSKADLSLFNQLLCDLYYLNPIQCLLQMASPGKYMDHRYITFGDVPVWQVTACVWTIIGVLSFLASLPIAYRQGKKSVPIPYEGMADVA